MPTGTGSGSIRKRVTASSSLRAAEGCIVNISAVQRAGLSGLNEGQAIEYEEVSDRGKTSAGNLKVRR